MRILLLTHGYPPYHSGGYELRCQDIVTRLAERGHEIEIITSRIIGSNSESFEYNISRCFHEIRGFTPAVKMIVYSYQDIRFLDRQIQEFAPDLIYLAHVINFSRYIYPYLAQLKIPIVYDEGGWGLTYAWKNHRWFATSPNPLKRVSKQIIRYILQNLSGGLLKAQWVWPADISVFFNNPDAMQYAEVNQVSVARRQTILPAVDLNLFLAPPREQLNNPINIIVVGRIEETKGTHDAVDLYEALQRAGISAQMIIVGKRTCENYYQRIVEKIKMLGARSITILSQVTHDEMAVLYRQSDICFFPSYHWKTGLSRVPLEAMASKCVVLSYGAESSKDIIQHGKTGFVVEPRNWDTMGDIIRSLIEDPAAYQGIVQNALAYVQTNHSFARYIAQIEQFLLNARQTYESE